MCLPVFPIVDDVIELGDGAAVPVSEAVLWWWWGADKDISWCPPLWPELWFPCTKSWCCAFSIVFGDVGMEDEVFLLFWGPKLFPDCCAEDLLPCATCEAAWAATAVVRDKCLYAPSLSKDMRLTSFFKISLSCVTNCKDTINQAIVVSLKILPKLNSKRENIFISVVILFKRVNE